jgi:hypothetical protein
MVLQQNKPVAVIAAPAKAGLLRFARNDRVDG